MNPSMSIAAQLHLTDVGHGPLSPESLPRPNGAVIWVRCSEASQLSAVETLGRHLTQDGDPIYFVTTMPQPVAGRAIAEPKGKRDVMRFVAHWQPTLVLWVHGHLDYVLLAAMHVARLPCILINAHADGFQYVTAGWLSRVLHPILAEFEMIFAVDQRAAERLMRAGASNDIVRITGELEQSEQALSCNETERHDLAQTIGSRPVWLAAGARLQEWEELCIAHRHASKRSHRLLLIVSPADASLGYIFAKNMADDGFQVKIRSDGEEPDEATQIYIADTDDELGLWYRIAPITYLSGTLAAGACRNPLEAAVLGSALLHGPQIAPYRTEAERLLAAGAAQLVRTADELGAAVEELLSADKAALMAHAGWETTSRGADVTNKVAEIIHDRLQQLGH